MLTAYLASLSHAEVVNLIRWTPATLIGFFILINVSRIRQLMR